MGQIDELKPTDRPRVMDLVRDAGMDVSDWANFKRGPRWAAANPKYCYEWSFVDPGRLVVLNMWYAHLRVSAGVVTITTNERPSHRSASTRPRKSVWYKRAENLDLAIQHAIRENVPVRVIINDGRMRSAKDPKTRASSVERRLLEPLPWVVTSYDWNNGRCTLARGAKARGSIDQFDAPVADEVAATRVPNSGFTFVRDPALREAALRRANGRCEFCGCAGFATPDGRVFLETHHVIPLSDGGTDSSDNIATVCPNHHREAHLGSRAPTIRETLLRRLATLHRRGAA